MVRRISLIIQWLENYKLFIINIYKKYTVSKEKYKLFKNKKFFLKNKVLILEINKNFNFF